VKLFGKRDVLGGAHVNYPGKVLHQHQESADGHLEMMLLVPERLESGLLLEM
jgi:hypothetical protein